MIEVSAILTGHREGVIAGPSIRSLLGAVRKVMAVGHTVEVVTVLDRADGITRQMFHEIRDSGLPLTEVVTNSGDPALARNAGVHASKGTYVAFLDADDLWSSNWLRDARDFCTTSPTRVVAHSEVNLVFGEAQQLWWHVDSEGRDFDPGYLTIGNYWDAMSFCHRGIFEEFPYRQNDLPAGFGHEDWHWNCETLAAGIMHRPVPDTMHFKRRRKISQMSACAQSDVVAWSNPLQEPRVSSRTV